MGNLRMTLSLPPCPPSLKPIQHFLKLATEHDTRDPVISYWSRLTALQTGLTLDKSSKKAAYIHNCLKNGETPIAGPLAEDEEDDNGEDANKEGETPREEDEEYIPSVPYNPPSAPTQAPAADMASMTISSPSPSSGTASLSYDKIARAQKLCKYAISALDYQDTNTAVENLTKALHLVKTGQEME